MKLAEAILLSLSVAFFIIGVHQTFTVGLLESYWIFMLTVACLLVYKIKRAGKSEVKNQSNPVLRKSGPVKYSSSHKKRSARK